MKKHSQMERFTYALAGLQAAWKREASFRTEVILFIGVMAFMLWMQPPLFWWAAVLFAAALVFMAELINTAIENICDALHPDHHPLIGAAKDCASAAVLVAVTAAITIFCGLVYWRWHC